jgi:hypothetical protein
MSHALVLMTAALLSAEPATEPPSSEPTPSASAPAAGSDLRSGESARQRALRRSTVPKYPRVDRPGVWIPAVVGLGFAGGAVTAYATAAHAHSQLERKQVITRQDVELLVSQGQTAQAITWALSGAALLAFGVSGYFYAQPESPAPPQPSLSVAPLQGGGVLVIQGVLP